MGAYQTFHTQLSPTTFLQPSAAAFQAAMGLVKDNLLDKLRQGIKARFPNLAPPDALNAIGAERQMPRLPNESDASYAGRLLAAWNSWPWAGTAFGMLSAFRGAGYPNVYLMQAGLQLSLDANGNLVATPEPAGAWITPLGSSFWSAFEVVFAPPYVSAWGLNPPADGTDLANQVKGIVTAWRPAFATCADIVCLRTGELWGFPIGLWGDAGTWGATTTVWSYP